LMTANVHSIEPLRTRWSGRPAGCRDPVRLDRRARRWALPFESGRSLSISRGSDRNSESVRSSAETVHFVALSKDIGQVAVLQPSGERSIGATPTIELRTCTLRGIFQTRNYARYSSFSPISERLPGQLEHRTINRGQTWRRCGTRSSEIFTLRGRLTVTGAMHLTNQHLLKRGYPRTYLLLKGRPF
jgi:hypothetical protein